MPRIDTLSGNFKIYQPDVGQRYSTDDMLTAWMAIICNEENTPNRFLDLGSGLCSVPMIVLWKFSQISGIGVELRENRYELGLKSLDMNGLLNRFKLLQGDLRNLELDEKFPIITSTPPYYTDSEGPISPHDDKSAARFELNGNIEDYFETANRHLSENGMFITVYPYQYKERVYTAAKKFKMFINKRVDMIPRKEKQPLISMYSISHVASKEEISTITVRNESGKYTSEYDQARIICGFQSVLL
jgi:tRNA1Val (adenine37-N6)-methyltransferase